MKKRLALCLILALLAISPAKAETAVPAFSNELFDAGKAALLLMSVGDYAEAAKTLPFEQEPISDRTLLFYIETNFTEIYSGGLQTEVAVAFFDGTVWTLAIPLLEPEDDEVETLLIFSNDGTTVSGLGRLLWFEVENRLALCPQVIWNIEYRPDAFIWID